MLKRDFRDGSEQGAVNVNNAYQSIVANTINNTEDIKFKSNGSREDPGISTRASQFISGNNIDIRGDVNYHTNHTHHSSALTIAQWLTSLSTPWYPAIQKETIQIASKTENAGQWLLKHTLFTQWKNGCFRRLLCSGIPGAGKTVLASIAIRELQSSLNSNCACIYIYFNHRDPEREDLRRLILALLAQLVYLQGQAFEPSPLLKNVYDSYKHKGMHPVLEESNELFRTEIDMFNRVYLVVDAVDECGESLPHSNREEFLRFICDLPQKVSVLLTSRPDDAIRKSGMSDHVITITANQQDLNHYIKNRINERGSTSALIRDAWKTDLGHEETIINKIVKKSEGMFLLAQLHVDYLNQQHTPGDFKSALETLPKTLDQAYGTSLERIQSKGKWKEDLALRALGWLVFAKRPLSIGQLLHALATVRGVTNIHENITSEDILIRSCAGLIVVDPGDKSRTSRERIVRLAHYSVETFYHESLAKHQPGFQSHVAEACLTYLSLPAFASNAFTEKDIKARLHEYPLFQYAANNWGQHFETGVKGEVYQLAAQFLNTPNLMHNASQVMRDARFSRERGIGPLHVAAYFGVGKLCRKLRENLKIPLNSTTNRKETALHWAAFYRQRETLKTLVELGADVNIKDKTGAAPLHRAVMNGDESAVEILVSHGSSETVNVNIVDKRGWTPLRWAAAYGQDGIINLLLKNRAVIDDVDADGWSALRWAAHRGHRKVVEILLQEKASVHCRDGWTLLHWAAGEGRTAMAQLSLEKGVDVDTMNAAGDTPLTLATRYGHSKIAWLLLQHGAKIDKLDKGGSTALHVAAALGEEMSASNSLLWLLLESGANIHTRDSSGCTALDIVVKNGRKSACWLLLEKGASIHGKDDNGSTVLHQALQGSSDVAIVHSICELLISHGARRDDQDKRGLTPLHIAAERGFTSIAELIVARGANLLKTTRADQTALEVAIYRGHEQVVRVLVEAEQELVKTRNSDLGTPLHLAASLGNLAMMNILLDNDGDANAHDWSHCTPLHRAAEGKYLNAVKLLLRRGGDPTLKNKDGSTVLHKAAAAGSEDLIRLLLECPAVDSTLKDVEGKTAWEVAQIWGHQLWQF